MSWCLIHKVASWNPRRCVGDLWELYLVNDTFGIQFAGLFRQTRCGNPKNNGLGPVTINNFNHFPIISVHPCYLSQANEKETPVIKERPDNVTVVVNVLANVLPRHPSFRFHFYKINGMCPSASRLCIN